MFPPPCPDYPACPRNRKGVYADKKRHLFLKMEPKSATDIIWRSLRSRWDCDICLWYVTGRGCRPAFPRLALIPFFFFFFFFLNLFFFLIHVTPSEVTSGETITYRRDSSFLKNHFPTLTRRPWGEWGENSLSYMKYLVTDQPAWSLRKQDGDCRS